MTFDSSPETTFKAKELRDRVILASVEVISAQHHFDLNPADPHGDASVEYAEDMLDAILDEVRAGVK